MNPHAHGKACRRIAILAALYAAAQVYLAACATRSVPPPERPPAPPAPQKAAPKREPFEATAYSVDGTTASGRETRHGIVAADPRVLPVGTRIRISGAGQYSGTYVVADTGRAIKGRHIDIFIADPAAARRFGKRSVEVEILHGDREATATTP